MLLPLVQEPTRPDAPPAPAVEQARPATVLVVDDEEIIRSLMKRTLEEAGYEVLLARNGREALDSLARHRGAVDLVLSDLVMPIMGGRELANRLAAEYAGLPVVWMSGHPKDMAPVSSAARGGGLFLQKPLAPDVLVETVAQALERRGVRRPGAASSPEA